MLRFRKLLFSLLFILLISPSFSQIPVMNFSQLEPLLHKSNDTTYVINFWATWCKPCVDELPAFEELNRKYSNKPVKVLLVSMDFVRNLESRVIPFIADNNLKSDIILLNDPKSHQWIDKVSPEWSGSIPATLIYNRSKRSFYERTFHFDKLESELKLHL
ncbi:MAG: TlpA family protein disulfide reductase [Bacteroidales bacterium]|nr:TlpA family protein disulfide reductase [Bacteroidales bacterium]